MAERKKYLDLNGLKIFWSKSKEYIDSITQGLDTSAADISSLKFNENAVIGDSGISITLNKSNISGTLNTSTSVSIPLKSEDTTGVITEVIEGKGIGTELKENGAIKVNVSVDDSSISIDESGKLSINTVDGGSI